MIGKKSIGSILGGAGGAGGPVTIALTPEDQAAIERVCLSLSFFLFLFRFCFC